MLFLNGLQVFSTVYLSDPQCEGLFSKLYPGEAVPEGFEGTLAGVGEPEAGEEKLQGHYAEGDED